MNCTICGDPMPEDETGIYDIPTQQGGHLYCMKVYLQVKHLADLLNAH